MRAKNDYYEESKEGFDAVMQRMMKVVGNPLHGSYAMALDVNENTIKTWRRRGEVSMKYLKGFSKEHNVSIDFLLHGEDGSITAIEIKKTPLTAEQMQAGYSVEVLSKEEQALLDNYRNCPQEAKHQIEASSALFAQLRKKKA